MQSVLNGFVLSRKTSTMSYGSLLSLLPPSGSLASRPALTAGAIRRVVASELGHAMNCFLHGPAINTVNVQRLTNAP